MSIEENIELFNLTNWGQNYFAIDSQGYLVATPDPSQPKAQIRLQDLAHKIRHAGLALPILVRFNNILHHRVQSLQNAFFSAIKDLNYQGDYTAVYPIKVNQQRRVVSELLKGGGAHFGLEAGSKPELLAVLGLAQHRNTLIICNGYKDREYIRIALAGQELGHRVCLIIEKHSELKLILEEAEALEITPCLGLRARLSSTAAGKWQNSGGEKSKFGLSAQEILNLVEELRTHNRLSWLNVLHMHMGSQISNIQDIHRGMQECARYYAELRQFGADIQIVDVGGGLGVDYEGSKSRSDCSINYSLQEYARNIIAPLQEICRELNLPEPHLISESGRALTAHHAMVITNIIDIDGPAPSLDIHPPQQTSCKLLQDAWKILQNLEKGNLVESYHNILQTQQEAQTLYIHGLIKLTDRAHIEKIYYGCLSQLKSLLSPQVKTQREILEDLDEKLSVKIFANFSLFQSVPDVWAIDQIFPIMPLSHLNKSCNMQATVHDLTCDSDGCFDLYVNKQGLTNTLSLPSYDAKSPYLLGIFMVGAYQEILGDIHNLFGDTDSIHVEIKQNGDVELLEPLHGDTVKDVLQFVHVEQQQLLTSYRKQLANSNLSQERAAAVMANLSSGLAGYTYLEDETWGR